MATTEITDDDLDLVETNRLIDALARRHTSIVVAGIVQATPEQYQTQVIFKPNAPSCVGLISILNTVCCTEMQKLHGLARRGTGESVEASEEQQ